MLVRWKEYKLLDGSTRKLVQRVGDGSLIRRFEKTPFPVADRDVVCPHFLIFGWAWGCPYNCAWCYLKGTYRWPYFQKNDHGRILPHFKDREKIKKHCSAFIEQVQAPEILNTGELSDSLMGENLKPAWSIFVQQIFQQTIHKVLYLTKGTAAANFVKNEWQQNAVMSWSINAVEVSKLWEHLAPSPLKRLNAAKKVYDAGYEVRLRIDPMVAIKDWQRKYREMIDEVFKREIQPERITLGTLRGLLSTLAHVKNHSWEQYLDRDSYSGWGYKPSDALRQRMYESIIDYLKVYGFRKVGICKETLKLWRNMQLPFDEIACNCILGDRS